MAGPGHLGAQRDLDSLQRQRHPTVPLALANVPWPGPWYRRAACRGMGTALWFGGPGRSIEAALALCAGCPVLDDCRAYAIRWPALRGIWGGLTDRQRERARERRRGQPQSAPPVKARKALAGG